jgi:cell division transport system permease protein
VPVKVFFFLREALRALRRNAAPSLAAVATVLITTLVLGVFIPVVRAATAKTNEVRNKIELEVFVNDDASRAEVTELGNMIRDIRHVESIEFVSKAEALRILKRRLGDKSSITEDLPGNPLPRSYRIKLDDPQNVDLVKAGLEPRATNGEPRPISPAIDEIKDREDDTEKILSATSTIKVMLAALATLLVLASILLVANTIRLSIFARRREVEVMRLVGATNWFIRWPFVIEGLLVGFLGGVVAVGLLWLAKITVVDPWSDRFALIAAPDTIRFSLLVIVLLGAATAVSAIGSGITLRRFLRV